MLGGCHGGQNGPESVGQVRDEVFEGSVPGLGLIQPVIRCLFPNICDVVLPVRKGHGSHQRPVHRFEIMERGLPWVEVDAADHEIFSQGPLLEIGKTVGFALSIGPADAHMTGPARFKPGNP